MTKFGRLCFTLVVCGARLVRCACFGTFSGAAHRARRMTWLWPLRVESEMWARVIEVMFGCWLAMSPFIFRHSTEERVLWVNDLSSATIVIVLALASFSQR